LSTDPKIETTKDRIKLTVLEAMGSYDPYYDIINLNPKLIEFPILYDFVVEHEIKHMENHRKPQPFLNVIYNDLKYDYSDQLFMSPVIGTQFKLFYKYLNENNPNNTLSTYYQMVLYFIFHLPLDLYIMIRQIFKGY